MALPTLTEPRLLWALLVLPLVWWLAQPPRPRRLLATAHLRLWLQARDALRRRPVRVRRLRTLLLLAAVALTVLAMAGPRSAALPGPDRLAVLLDGSASTAAREADGSRAADALRAELRAGLARVPDHVAVRVLQTGATLQRLEGPAARTLVDLRDPGGAAGVDLARVAGLLADARTAIWTLTDGQGGAAPAAGALTVRGGRRDNWSIAAVELRDRWPLPGLSLRVDLASFADAPATATLTARGAVRTEVRATKDLAPGARAALTLDVERSAAGGQLELALAVPGDALAEDDLWAAQLPALPAPRIAVLAAAESGPAIHVAARALAGEVAGTVVEAADAERAALLLVEGGEVDLEPGRARAFLFGTSRPGQGALRPWMDPVVSDWNRSDPITAGLDLSDLRIRQAWHGLLPPGTVLLWGDGGAGPEPLIVLAEGDAMASLHCAFRLHDSNLPLLPAFPQLLRRGLLRAYGPGAAIQPVTVCLPAAESDLRVRGPAADRALAAFGSPGHSLAGLALALALGLMALRAWVR